MISFFFYTGLILTPNTSPLSVCTSVWRLFIYLSFRLSVCLSAYSLACAFSPKFTFVRARVVLVNHRGLGIPHLVEPVLEAVGTWCWNNCLLDSVPRIHYSHWEKVGSGSMFDLMSLNKVLCYTASKCLCFLRHLSGCTGVEKFAGDSADTRPSTIFKASSQTERKFVKWKRAVLWRHLYDAFFQRWRRNYQSLPKTLIGVKR